MDKYNEFESLLSEIAENVQSCQDFGHSMKVSQELNKAVEMLKCVVHCFDDLSDMIKEAYEI